jgi:hypothetical protein
VQSEGAWCPSANVAEWYCTNEEMLKMLYTTDLIGLTKENALLKIKASGLKSRIVEEDDESFIVTMDYVVNRFNLTIGKGVVTSVFVG